MQLEDANKHNKTQQTKHKPQHTNEYRTYQTTYYTTKLTSTQTANPPIWQYQPALPGPFKARVAQPNPIMTHLRHGRPHRIRGWGLVKARGARLAQRRYMRLIHYTLTVFDAADEDNDLVLFEEILVGAEVTLANRRREIVVRFPADRFVVQLRTEKEFDAWSRAFRDAARVATHFYKLVETRELGAGAFSTVYFGFDRDDGHHVAIKVVDKTRCSRAELAHAETEARMMAYVRHLSIIQCRDIFDAPEAMHVVMEYMSGATLEQRMLALPPGKKAFPESIAATIMSHVLDALAYLESERVCHRDVKPDNILLSTLPKDALWATSARLSDFGLAAFVESDMDLTDIVGTPHYVAPEVISRDGDNERIGYGTQVDVWAAGILMYWMLTGGHMPFDGVDSAGIFKSIRAAQLDLSKEPWGSISADAKSLLKSLLHPRPYTRIRSTAARMHPWLRKAHVVLPVAGWAWEYRDTTVRKERLSGLGRFRSAIMAVMACNGFAEIVDVEYIALQKKAQGERLKVQRIGKKASLEEKMQRAPERAPAGADGLGYNVGLIPSFVPKRRARAGVSPPGIRDRISGEKTRSMRTSRESGSSGGSRAPSGDRGSLERNGPRLTGGKSAWALRIRGRSVDKEREGE